MRPISAPLPVGDHLDTPQLLLRDGTVTSVRTAGAADRSAIRRFSHDLSPESRYKRFFAPSEPSDAIIGRLSDSSDPSRALTLVVHRQLDADYRPRQRARGLSHAAGRGATAVAAAAHQNEEAIFFQ